MYRVRSSTLVSRHLSTSTIIINVSWLVQQLDSDISIHTIIFKGVNLYDQAL
jgi:hypothetical protein